MFPTNTGTELPVRQAVILVFDAATGMPAALMDGTHITAARTGACSALSVRLLAREDASRLAILGTGAQHARMHSALPGTSVSRNTGRRTRPGKGGSLPPSCRASSIATRAPRTPTTGARQSRRRLCDDLRDRAGRSPRLDRCEAAYYLGRVQPPRPARSMTRPSLTRCSSSNHVRRRSPRFPRIAISPNPSSEA